MIKIYSYIKYKDDSNIRIVVPAKEASKYPSQHVFGIFPEILKMDPNLIFLDGKCTKIVPNKILKLFYYFPTKIWNITNVMVSLPIALKE